MICILTTLHSIISIQSNKTKNIRYTKNIQCHTQRYNKTRTHTHKIILNPFPVERVCEL